MSSGIYNINESFSFDQLVLNPPIVTSGGNYFIKYAMNGKPLYIQPPECKTKGTISKSSKKPYCDLMFTNEHTHLIKWMEDLETHSCKLIYENREQWFEGEMELSDIENYFASPMKIYKGGKFYLVRANIPCRLGKIQLKVYNEHRQEISIEQIIENTNVITVLEIQGIKCSSRSFQIEMEIKQLMTLEPVNLFENCLINIRQPVTTMPIVMSGPKGNNNMDPHDLEEMNEDENTETLENNEMDSKESLEESRTLEETKKIQESQNTNVQEKEEKEEKENVEKNEPIIVQTTQPNELEDLEFHVDLEKLDGEHVSLKPHNDIYYERYKEARKRALVAKNLALQAFLEAREIKHTYQLDDIESDSDDDFFQTKLSNQNSESFTEA